MPNSLKKRKKFILICGAIQRGSIFFMVICPFLVTWLGPGTIVLLVLIFPSKFTFHLVFFLEGITTSANINAMQVVGGDSAARKTVSATQPR